jgi:hypothetical protein
VAASDWSVPLRADRLYEPLDRGTIGRLRSVRGKLTGDVNSGEVSGSAVDSGSLRWWQGGERGASCDGSPGDVLGGG